MKVYLRLHAAVNTLLPARSLRFVFGQYVATDNCAVLRNYNVCCLKLNVVLWYAVKHLTQNKATSRWQCECTCHTWDTCPHRCDRTWLWRDRQGDHQSHMWLRKSQFQALTVSFCTWNNFIMAIRIFIKFSNGNRYRNVFVKLNFKSEIHIHALLSNYQLY